MKARTAKSPQPEVRMFFSYAHADPTYYKSTLERILRWPDVQTLSMWSDKDIVIGSKPDEDIRAELGKMDIFVALVTQNFAFSRYIREVELGIAQARAEAPDAKKDPDKKQVWVVPVVIDHPQRGEYEIVDWLLEHEWLPDTKTRQSWAEMMDKCGATRGYIDTTQRILREGVRRVVDEVIAVKQRRMARGRKGP